MARQESDREDLMREAAALGQRAEFAVPAEPQTVIAGYRRDGSLSIYFGADPCLHFDSQLRLRRAFIEGDLYRTQGDTLARLQRSRKESVVELRRHDLTPDELTFLLTGLADRLRRLLSDLEGEYRCLQSVPPQVDLQPRLAASLARILKTSIALAPAIRGKQ